MMYIAKVKSKIVKGTKEEMEICFGPEKFWVEDDYSRGYAAPTTEDEYFEGEEEADKISQMSNIPNIMEVLDVVEDAEGHPIGYYDCWGNPTALDEEFCECASDETDDPYDDIFTDMPSGVAESYNTGW